jgi:hypothetical protein
VSWGEILVGLLASLVLFAAGLAGVVFFLVKLPAAYFAGDEPQKPFWGDRHPILRWTGRILKNVAGVVVVVLGFVMALPGVPGPGVFTMLLGVMLLDYPGKRRFERWVIRRPRLHATADRIRRRYGKPPLILDEETPPRGGDGTLGGGTG